MYYSVDQNPGNLHRQELFLEAFDIAKVKLDFFVLGINVFGRCLGDSFESFEDQGNAANTGPCGGGHR